jgi:dipeptidyl-peptidase-3
MEVKGVKGVKGVKDVSSTAGDIQVKEVKGVKGVKDDSLAAGNIQPDTSRTAVAEGHITPLSSLTSKQAELASFKYTDQRFADIQLLRYRVKDFETLTPRQRILVYYLSEAALAGRDILWDQNGRYNLRIRRLLETVYVYYDGNRQSDDFKALETYLKRVWFSNGIHHHYSTDKLQPAFSPTFLRTAAASVKDKLTLDAEELFPVIFDPAVMPKRVNQNEDDDLLATSASNYYGEGVGQAEAEDFYAKQKAAAADQSRPVMYGMNSRLVKENGTLKERVWHSGGLYGAAIDRIIHWLEKAKGVAENDGQAAVIDKLVEFYRTGDLHTFDEYTILWVNDTEGDVDFTNGFTEVYGDPLGLKASWEGFSNFKDKEATTRTEKLSANAQWFEDHSPVDPRFRKPECRGVTAKVIVAAMLGGDLYPSSAIGINLPNSNWVRAEHGSKSVTIGNLTEAYNEAARQNGFLDEFVVDEPTLALVRRYGDACDDLHTDLHECLGHGSGRLLDGVDPDALKAYGSCIEEARADLFALYYIADAKLVSLGLVPDGEAYKSQYYTYMMNGLMTQLVRIEPGAVIEEAHMRNRALIARWVLARAASNSASTTPAVALVSRDNKSYVQINDYEALRSLFAELLAEVQRIKSEGDYAAAANLVETYGVSIDARLHQEVRQRYAALDIAPYKGFINPEYEPVYDSDGNITDVSISYGEAYDHQMLRYSRDYATLPLIND